MGGGLQVPCMEYHVWSTRIDILSIMNLLSICTLVSKYTVVYILFWLPTCTRQAVGMPYGGQESTTNPTFPMCKQESYGGRSLFVWYAQQHTDAKLTMCGPTVVTNGQREKVAGSYGYRNQQCTKNNMEP